MSLAIVGIDYPNERGPTRRFEAELCEPGEPLELRPEPKNPYDEHAIAVFSMRGVQLGYVPSERAVWIGSLIRRGTVVNAIFGMLQGSVAWARVAFDGEVPTLPEKRESPHEVDDSGFWPDREYDEWRNL